MPAKRQKASSSFTSSFSFTSSSSSSSTNCDTIPIIKQRFGTCWFNAILTCLLYGDKSKNIFRHKLRNPNFDKLIGNHFRKRTKIYKEKLKDTEEDKEQLYRQQAFKLVLTKQALHEIQESLTKIINYTEQTDINFDMAIGLLIELNNYDPNIFTIEATMDPENLRNFIVCPPNIHMQVAYALNIYKIFGIKAFAIQKTLTEKDYEDKCILFEYKPHQSNVIWYDDTPDVIIVVDEKKERTSAIIETLKYNDKYYSLDSIKFCNVRRSKQETNLHAISCVKCKKRYYISDTNCNRLLPIDISNNNLWYIKKYYGPNSIYCSQIVYDTPTDEMLFNIYEGSTRKIYFYLKTKSHPEQHSVIYKNEDSILLVPSVIYEDSS